MADATKTVVKPPVMPKKLVVKSEYVYAEMLHIYASPELVMNRGQFYKLKKDFVETALLACDPPAARIVTIDQIPKNAKIRKRSKPDPADEFNGNPRPTIRQSDKETDEVDDYLKDDEMITE